MSSREHISTSKATVAIFCGAMLLSFIVLNRWLVTDLGLFSFGRVWQFYISYEDFGFIRRALLGTVLSATGINTIFANEYVFAFFTQHIAIVVLVGLITHYCIKFELTNPVFLFGVAFSPALIIHSGYTTGSLDVFILICALLNILYVRNSLLFGSVLVIGVLIHELFLFTVPAQICAFLFIRKPEVNHGARNIALFVLVLLVAAIAVIVSSAKTDLSELEFGNAMREHLPNATGRHSHWSGYFEVGSEVAPNMNATDAVFEKLKSGGFLFLAIPLLYVVILTLRAARYARTNSEAAFLVAAIATPLLVIFVATDVHRWIAMSANMALLLTLALAVRAGSTVSSWNYPIAFFCLVAPFGAAELERPFPLHQFALENLQISNLQAPLHSGSA